MYDLLMGVSAIFALGFFYFLAGLIIPTLPFVRSRGRAAGFMVLSLVVMTVFGTIARATMTPEQRQATAALDAQKARDRDQKTAAEQSAREAETRQAAQKEGAARVARADAEIGKWKDATIPLQTLLSMYDDNEVAADLRFKGKPIQVSGIVGDVKKDILNQAYVIVGTGQEFEIPTVQCMFDRGAEDEAAALRKGREITVRGTVSGLMMNVIVRGCDVQ